MMRDAGLEDCRYHNLARRHRRAAPRAPVLTCCSQRLAGHAESQRRGLAARAGARAPARRSRARARARAARRCASSCEVADGRIALTERRDTPADARLSGTPLSLLALAGPEAEGRCAAATCASKATRRSRRRSASCSSMRARTSRKSCRGSSATSRRTRSATSRASCSTSVAARPTRSRTSVAEYLQEEGRDVPARIEVEEFLAGRRPAARRRRAARGAARAGSRRGAMAAAVEPRRRS